ncbi:hypothetical protein NP233_g11795 [Leucocoprinus birnbaumii]|uniref:NACHT domain-containing protein n=1 Tax=Leucocoprinus birnbaumii TaxID=56174 RepID=A0AAD5VJF0_9AGAR|nr:hypothetical protein NP233_g11795 [Leucocoprinus birnbaumii]
MALLKRYHPPHRVYPHSAGAFVNARDFVISNSLFLGSSNAPDNFMEKFLEYTIRGAELDSSARDPPPRCHPNTRISILQRMEFWLRNPCRAKRMLWLVGPAGVGKSAIMQTAAESECRSSLLAALFFSAPNGRNDPRRVITTLAYQLAAKYPPYREYIRARIMDDPNILEKSIIGQFTEFIVKPFAVRRLFDGMHQVLIFIDGLDECKGEREQILLLSLISYFTTRFPDVPLLWIVSSRPEAHITRHLSQKRFASCFDQEQVLIDSPEACRDVERFVRAEFDKIRRSRSVIMLHFPNWPCEKHLLKFLASAQGLFAYADTATRFIAERDHINRFQLVLDLIDQPSSSASPTSVTQPLARLDALYEHIVNQVDPEDLKYAKQVFSHLLFPVSFEDYAFQFQVCNWLEISPDILHSALSKLHSVLIIPPPDEEFDTIRWYHKSFYDFLHRMRSRLGLPMNKDDAAEISRQRLIRHLNRIPLTNSPTAPAIPPHLLSWPYQTPLQVEGALEKFARYLTCVCIGDSGITGLSHESTPDILYAVKVIASFDFSEYSAISPWFDDIFFKLAKQLRDDGSLLDLPAKVFVPDSIDKNNFKLVNKGWVCSAFSSDKYDYAMHLWKTKHPEILLQAFIGNRLQGWVNCTALLPKFGEGNLEDRDRDWIAMHDETAGLYLRYNFSMIYRKTFELDNAAMEQVQWHVS